jgi:hypothetical protein
VARGWKFGRCLALEWKTRVALETWPNGGEIKKLN